MDAQLAEITRKKDRTVVAVNGSMTVGYAVELRTRLLEAFSNGQPVELCLAGMTAIDLTGLQLLCSCHKTAMTRGVAFTVTCGTDALSTVAAAAGMYRHKGCVADVGGTCVWLNGMDKVTA